MVADLEPGESAEFTIPANNFNGSSASDQVYGFGGFDSTSDEQRRIMVRRQVIDALVGYGGMVTDGFVSSGGRGPYLVGWASGEGPMPVVVDGQRVQRYETLVEVISARPSLGSGEAVLRPQHMSVSIIATDGDASPAGPGIVTLGSGSATFSISLPLEASGLVPTEVTLVVAPDPGIAASDPGAFGGFWPPGYTLEVLDPTSGTWTNLGDVSQQSRFDVDDPASVMSASGRIQARVTGAAGGNFGGNQFFVSAGVSGVVQP
jgi:hypothetical protein